MSESVRQTLHHPIISIGVIISIIGLFAAGFATGNGLENQINANTKDIAHEEELRKQEYRYVKEELVEIKELLGKLLIRGDKG